MTTQENLLKFVAFKSQVDPNFWQRLTELKLDKDKLKENVHKIWGYYSNKKPEGQNQFLYVDASSFNGLPDENRIFGVGSIINKNTIEGFKEEDKLEIIKSEGKLMLESFKEEALKQPSLLARFFIFCFANLKSFLYYYWFAFPAPTFLFAQNLTPPKNILDVFSGEQLKILCNSYSSHLNSHNKGFFFVREANESIELFTVEEGMGKLNSHENWFLGFSDSSSSHYPSWPLRNFLALVTYHCPEFVKSPLKIICLRLDFEECQWSPRNSILLNVKVTLKKNTLEDSLSENYWVGWEKNEKRGKAGPKLVSLKHFLDPVHLAEASAELNLKLMKWQILPDLDLNAIKESKCMLIGAGTLGCVVARNLMAWGVRKVTFLDSGTISHSNPVRQFLYKFEDVGKSKAETAAAAVREIFPGMVSSGFCFNIPMPGHPVGDSMMEETKRNVRKLEELIGEHDATFLLTDSRESRWLPTLLASAMGKLVINAAVGFDSYLVIRHGMKSNSPARKKEKSPTKMLSADELGCYFCSDVTAPGNSARGRTLDRQCTVTRPGISSVAGSIAVELFISILQHPRGASAPAETGSKLAETGSDLGMLPHSVRGFLSHYQTVLPAVEAFSSCVACSEKVIHHYRKEGFEFVRKSLESKDYLENICGLTELRNEALVQNITEYTSSESDE